MKQIAVRIPDEVYETLKMHTAQNGQSISEFICSLIGTELETEMKPDSKNIGVRIPEKEYALMKQYIVENQYPGIREFVVSLISDDLQNGSISRKFETEDTSGSFRTISFQTNDAFYKSVRYRVLGLNLSIQDYIKTLIYERTH